MELSVHFSGTLRRDFGEHDYREMILQPLHRYRHRLRRVALYIEDTNGPRGGEDKQCRCVLHLLRMQPIVISDRDQSLISLLHRVANRASHALSRRSNQLASRAKQRQEPHNFEDFQS